MKGVRFLLSFLFVSFFLGVSSELAAQNTETPDVVAEVIDEIQLGVRVNGGIQFRRQDLLPLEERSLNYLTRPVSGELSHSVPYYGVGVALRGYGAKLAFAFQFGDGVQTVHRIPFENGGGSIPYKPDYREWSLRAQYFVTDWIGVGLAYHGRRDNLNQSFETPIEGEIVASAIFRVDASRNRMSVYVPVQRKWGRVRLFGRVGSSVFGRANEFYNTGFVRYQSPERPGRVTNQDPDVPNRFEKEEQSMNAQFARVGAEVPVWQTSVRGSFGSSA